MVQSLGVINNLGIATPNKQSHTDTKMRLSQIIAEATELDYTGIDPDIKNRLQKYKPHEQQWALQQLRNGEHTESVIDALEYYIKTIKDNRYQQLLAEKTPTPKNILSLSLDDIKTTQHTFETTYNAPTKKELAKKVTQILVDTPDLKIEKYELQGPNDEITPKALAAAASMSKWCVVNPETADHYLYQGPIYLITDNTPAYLPAYDHQEYTNETYINKKLSKYKRPKAGNKYLCHPKTNQLMDLNNKVVAVDAPTAEKIAKYIPEFGTFCYDYDSDIAKQEIIKTPSQIYYYAKQHLKKRWPEAENTLVQDYYYATAYLKHFKNKFATNRWPELENQLLNAKNQKDLYNYAKDIIQGRWPEAEPTIIKDPYWAAQYARNVLKTKWPEAEPTIMKDPHSTRLYQDLLNFPLMYKRDRYDLLP